MDGILTSPLKTPNPFNHQLHGRKPFDTHLNDARTGTEFFQKFGDSAVYAMSFDPRIKSNRGWVEKSLYASDFSADADGWTSDTLITLTGNIDSIDGENDNLELAYGASGTEQVTLPTTLSVGCLYKITFDAYHPAANVTLGSSAYAKLYNNLTSVATIGTTEGSWESVSATFKAQASSLWIGESLTATNGDKLYIRNVTIKQVIKNPVVHVLRDSDSSYRSFTAPEIASGVMTGWVTDGDATANGLIHTAYDPSGNGNDATQTTVANMPKIVDAGTLVTDALGNVAELGDGSDDQMGFTQVALNDFLVMAVVDFPTVPSLEDTILGGGAGDWLAVNNNPGGTKIRIDGTAGIILGTTALGSGTSYLITFIRTGSSVSYYLNGSLEGSGTNSNELTLNTLLSKGSSNWLNAKLSAAFIFNADMSAQRPAIEAALANIYGITLA